MSMHRHRASRGLIAQKLQETQIKEFGELLQFFHETTARNVADIDQKRKLRIKNITKRLATKNNNNWTWKL